jgi:hypothetical protein
MVQLIFKCQRTRPANWGIFDGRSDANAQNGNFSVELTCFSYAKRFTKDLNMQSTASHVKGGTRGRPCGRDPPQTGSTISGFEELATSGSEN